MKLAREAGIHERHAREWLEQQAVAGVVDVAEDHADEYERRFLLPTGHAEALLDADSPAFAVAAPQALRGLATVFGDVLRAYRSGGGVPYSEQGADVRRSIAGINRPMFVNELGSAWLSAVPELHARLRSLAEPRVLDLGCETGWSSIALARAYPQARIDAVDLGASSIEEARRHAAEAGVSDRVSFEVRDAVRLAPERYDLVCAFEALHDMAHPI